MSKTWKVFLVNYNKIHAQEAAKISLENSEKFFFLGNRKLVTVE